MALGAWVGLQLAGAHVDTQSRREIALVTIATLVPIPLITTAVIAVLVH